MNKKLLRRPAWAPTDVYEAEKLVEHIQNDLLRTNQRVSDLATSSEISTSTIYNIRKRGDLDHYRPQLRTISQLGRAMGYRLVAVRRRDLESDEEIAERVAEELADA